MQIYFCSPPKSNIVVATIIANFLKFVDSNSIRKMVIFFKLLAIHIYNFSGHWNYMGPWMSIQKIQLNLLYFTRSIMTNELCRELRSVFCFETFVCRASEKLRICWALVTFSKCSLSTPDIHAVHWHVKKYCSERHCWRSENDIRLQCGPEENNRMTWHLSKHDVAHISGTVNRMAWQWVETLVEIRVTLADIKELPNTGADAIFPNMNLTGLYV